MVSLVWQRAAGLVGAAKESEAGIQECLLPMTLILVIICWHLPHSNDLHSIALGYNGMGRSSQPLSQPTAKCTQETVKRPEEGPPT